MKINASKTFFKSLKRLNSPLRNWRAFKCWVRYHKKKDFFHILHTAWHGYPWDESYMLELERAKLLEMIHYHEKAQRFVGWEYVVRDMKICVSLIGIMLEEKQMFHFNGDLTFTPTKEYPNDYEVGHTPDFKYVCDVKVNLKNARRFIDKCHFEDTEPSFEYFLNYYEKSPHELYLKKARYLYFKIRYEHGEEWWD